MERFAQQNSKIKGIALPSSPEISTPENSRQASRRVKLDLMTLLAETPEQSIDFNWENIPPAGRESR